MDFPSFDDYLMTLDQEKVETWIDEANKQQYSFSFSQTDSGLKNLSTAIIKYNFAVTRFFLEDYHGWLASELEANSLRLVPRKK